MNPLDEYIEMTKSAGFLDLARGAWRGLSGAAKPVMQAAQQTLPGMGAQIGAVAPKSFAAVERGYELGQQLQKPVALAAGGALIGAGAMAFKKIQNSIGKRRDFKQMMQTDPELASLQKERPKFFNQAYSSLRDINPTFGRDPIVAGSYMRKMMANPDAAGLTLAQSIKAPYAQSGPASLETSIGPFKIGL